MKPIRKSFDFLILITVLILLAFGIIIVFSASAPLAASTSKNTYAVVQDQLIFAGLGIIAMLVMANFDYRVLYKLAPLIMVVSIILLILVLVPGIGREVKDTWRWIYIGPIHFQPSEIAKLAVILFLARSVSNRKNKIRSFFKGLLPYFLLIAVISALLLKEPHLSCTIIVVLVSAVILFAAGAKIFHFVILAVPAVAGLGIVVATVPYMQKRVLSFINPWNDLQGDGWQVVQSLYAIGSGGLFGRGLGKSMQKFLYIPEPHNDFIFPVLAEELGFVGVVAVMALFMILIWRGIKVAVTAPDMFGSLTAVGITSLIAIQTLLNIAVVTSSVPPTGVSLPFFSAGGTSLLLFLTEMGILLNISRYANYDRP